MILGSHRVRTSMTSHMKIELVNRRLISDITLYSRIRIIAVSTQGKEVNKDPDIKFG